MNVPMEENAPPAPSVLVRIKKNLTDPRIRVILALTLALGAASGYFGGRLYLKSVRVGANARYQSHQGLMRLYDLQIEYRKGHEAYANDLETLLATAPDGAQLREKLKAAMDINTLAVIGDADRFRLEANVLDPQRTLVKIRGPLGER